MQQKHVTIIWETQETTQKYINNKAFIKLVRMNLRFFPHSLCLFYTPWPTRTNTKLPDIMQTDWHYLLLIYYFTKRADEYKWAEVAQTLRIIVSFLILKSI